jgi:hypothetical protein
VDALFAFVSRPWVGALLLCLGTAVAAIGTARRWPDLRRPASDPRKALALVRALRTAILGAATASIGAAGLADVPALAGLALVVAAEEALETSVVVAAFRAAPGLAPRG